MQEQEIARFEQAKAKIIGKDRQRMGIGTYSEKTVHAIFKNYYEPERRSRRFPSTDILQISLPGRRS